MGKDSWTPEETALIAQHHAAGMRIGTCTLPADRPTTERCITAMYSLTGRPAPEFTWVLSPFAALECIRAAMPEYAHSVPPFFAGGEESYWVQFYLCGGKLRGVRYEPSSERLLALWGELTTASGWWFPFERGVVACDRPDIIRLDEARVPHCADGPARRHRDGTEEYFWHGVAVPKQWITDPSTAISHALTHENIEMRRAAAEIAGWSNVLASIPHRIIDKDPDPLLGSLISVDLPDAPDERFLLVRCGTGRDFALCVTRRNAEFRTAREANAATYGMSPSVFSPEGRS